jgi:hypothetical protein
VTGVTEKEENENRTESFLKSHWLITPKISQSTITSRFRKFSNSSFKKNEESRNYVHHRIIVKLLEAKNENKNLKSASLKKKLYMNKIRI